MEKQGEFVFQFSLLYEIILVKKGLKCSRLFILASPVLV